MKEMKKGSGGKKNTDMKKMGRGLAKVSAQKRSAKVPADKGKIV